MRAVNRCLEQRRSHSLFGSNASGPIGVLISLETTDTNWTLRGAGQLVITPAAVAKHVANIFAKLDLGPNEDNRRVRAVLAYLNGVR